jgi:hypothetical protein
VTSVAKGPLKNGQEITCTLHYKGKALCNFTTYYWDKETYERAFRNAGFRNIKWIKMKISKEGIEKHGKEFWREFMENPYLTLIKAKK